MAAKSAPAGKPSPAQTKVKLPSVTVCSADSAYVELTARALAKSQELCSFGDAILFSDQPCDGPFRHVPIPKLTSIDAYSHFCLTGLPGLIETDFALVIQWDGYVVNTEAWRPAFLKCDYIGSPWPGQPRNQNVGNGGFSLRSSRLLKALKHFPVLSNYAEDIAIGMFHRPELESRFGVRFADEKLANRFSHEWLPRESFGFHGFHNLWRYLSDAETVEVTDIVWQSGFTHWKSVWLIADAYEGGRMELATELYARLRSRLAYADIRRSEVFDVPEAQRTILGASQTTDSIFQKLEFGQSVQRQ